MRERRFFFNDIRVIETEHTRYQGEMKGEKKHGFGIMVYEDYSVYTGEWVGDQRHGDGVLEYADGSFFMGEWLGDQQNDGIREYLDGTRDTQKMNTDNMPIDCKHVDSLASSKKQS